MGEGGGGRGVGGEEAVIREGLLELFKNRMQENACETKIEKIQYEKSFSVVSNLNCTA